MGTDQPANQEMVDGYLDGRNADTPEPSANRSQSYRHGWQVGRAEIERRRLGKCDEVRERADNAMRADAANAMPLI